jgi:hypothetical protein
VPRLDWRWRSIAWLVLRTARGQEAKLMTIWRTLMICAATIAASSIGVQAGPCYDQIYRMEARLESLLQANPQRGPPRLRAPRPFSTASPRASRSRPS